MSFRQNRPTLNEAEVRAKVIDVWLADHGFDPSNIDLERSFEIQLGRGVLRIGGGLRKRLAATAGGRADYIVRTTDGRNLFVVEAKASNESLDESARSQALTYALLLRDGIAPFAIVTNGYEAKIYDTITRALVSDTAVPIDHRYAQAGFRVTCADLALRAEALERLISLDEGNLLSFCREQAAFHMRRLRSEDINSGLKYIPALYVDREASRTDLDRLLDEHHVRCVIVVGEPQVGKTNFACNFVEQRLASGRPCLFYPAVGMQHGLAEEIRQDFEEVFHDGASAHQIIANKLARVLTRSAKRLVIVIDAWNEADFVLAKTIDRECSRLCSDQIQIVLTMTNVAARRLLFDESGNPSEIAVELRLDRNSIPLVELDPASAAKRSSLVEITRYSEAEMGEAYEVYANAFRVTVPDGHDHTRDPLLLRNAMEVYRGNTLPLNLDEPDLLVRRIKAKLDRAVGVSQDEGCVALSEVGERIALSAYPCEERAIVGRFPLKESLFEAALLARVRSNDGPPLIDFYYSRERDYVIAFWARDWPRRLSGEWEQLKQEALAVSISQAGRDALRWYLTSEGRQEVLLALARGFKELTPDLKKLVLNAVGVVGTKADDINALDVLERTNALSDPDKTVRVAGAKILAFHDDDEPLAEFMATGYDRHLLLSLLEVDEEFPLSDGSGGEIVLKAIQSASFNLDADGDSIIVADLIGLLTDARPSVRSSSSKALGFANPRRLISSLGKILGGQAVSAEPGEPDRMSQGIHLAIDQLNSEYWGDMMCKGWLSYAEPEDEERIAEKERMSILCGPLIAALGNHEAGQALRELLNDILSEKDGADASPLEKQMPRDRDPRQRELF